MDPLDSWRHERESAYLYRRLAVVEQHPAFKSLFASLAQSAEEQAKEWERQYRDRTGAAVPSFRPGLRAWIVAQLMRWISPQHLRTVLASMKVRGVSVYRGGHPQRHMIPISVDDVGQRHKGVDRGGSLRAAVFGINDGLVSNASLVMGMAGATSESATIYLAGVAGMLAGAFSMAAGEYISMRSQRELFEYQIGLERDELAVYPEEEAEELALIYNARGVPLDEARQIAHALIKDPGHALDTLAREELGLNPDDLGSPWGAALASFTAFSVGAFVPMVPFVLGAGGIGATIALTLISLFGVGVTLSLFTGHSAWRSGLRMLIIGASAGAVTYALGSVLGVALA